MRPLSTTRMKQPHSMAIFSVIKNLIGRKKANRAPGSNLAAHVIPRSDHAVSRADISTNALKVMRRLHQHDYDAYLVGGGVRDLLIRHAPKDFDVVTNARPEQIRKLFRNCRLIGRRFRLAHVHFGREIIEVATFRAASKITHEQRAISEGLISSDSVYGSIEEDALRRDFTVNALYYNIADFSIVDFTQGYEDLKNRTLRLIGDPAERYEEDPVRILRAIRFAAKLDFRLHADTASPIAHMKSHLETVSSARLFEEVNKLFLQGSALKSFDVLQEYDLFSQLFPLTAECLAQSSEDYFLQLLRQTLIKTDERIAANMPVTPAFFLAVVLWLPLQEAREKIQAEGVPPLPALEQAMSQVICEQVKTLAIPKRLSKVMREIWLLQYRLPRRYGLRPVRLLQHPRFRAGYDFLLLRAEVGDAPQELAEWWTTFQSCDEEAQTTMIAALSQQDKTQRPRKRRKRSVKKSND